MARLTDLKEKATLYYPIALKSAIHLQRVFRGSKLRAWIKYRTLAAIKITRVFRGHCGRKKVKNCKMALRDERIKLMYLYFASILQRTFRGFYSRKYKQNHARRKRMLQAVIDKGEEVRRGMYEYAVDQAIREEAEGKNKQEKEFRALAENLHHLVSTQSIAGVYNPPIEYLETPTVNDLPVEVHIRAVVKDLLHTKGFRKSGLIRDVNGTLQIPLKTSQNKLSLQASARYDCIEEEKRRIETLHKVLSMDPNKQFIVTGGKTNIINEKVIPLNAGDVYVEPWANPMLVRGVPESQAQLLESAYTRKALFATSPAVPFISSASGNKSAVRPNGDFDVIADALTTGGVTKRHLGKTARFGVPDNADFRPKSGTAMPAAPLRSTTLRLYRPKQQKHRVIVRPLSLGGDTKRPETQEVENVDSSDDEM